MKTLLQINASLFSDQGQSSQLASRFVARWVRENPSGRVIVRDLASTPLPHLTAERFQAFLAPAEERTPAQAAIAHESDELIAELRAADVIVIGLPMYNFGIPSTLKAWIDHVARAGQTFSYSENGPVGLLEDRKVYLFATRGGQYEGTARDTQSGYMRDFLQLIGIRDVEIIYAEGLALGEESQKQALGAAAARIDGLVSALRLAA